MSDIMHHVDYELAMLVGVESYWGEYSSEFMNNMFNVCGYVACKNLLDFLESRGVEIPENIKRYRSMILTQITTLTEHRTDVQEEKLQPEHFFEMVKFIRAHLNSR